ncbi:YheU family protein [Methylotetracoccus oryzae]|uniref:YheU family protein n=1 Tax=Methylotetracoccus oryzae TaxID=1919059 RepID=UPI001117BB8C|nr:YheU family protein [Methylotetracoccus oryzae]
MIIPHRQLTPDTLQRLIEEFVTRDGTDYGEQETPLQVRVSQVQRQLELGNAVIIFDEDEECCTILPVERVVPANGERQSD